jgi:hypothetical protein
MKGLLSELPRDLLEACEKVWVYGSLSVGDGAVTVVLEDAWGRVLTAAEFATEEDAWAVVEEWQAFKDGRKEAN